MGTVKLVIVDDHKIIRDGLLAILKEVEEIDVVGEVGSGDALLDLLATHIQVDVILLDMHMPLKNGIEVTKEVRAQFPKCRILINTMSETPEEIERAVSAGVNGYLIKTSGSEELVKAITMVAHGNTYYGSAVVNTFIKNVTKPVTTTKGITPTELKIIRLLYEEKKLSEISEEMKITKPTLTTHLQNMYRKLNIRTEMGLVKYALKEKLIE